MDCTHFVTFLLCSKPFGPAAPIHLLKDYARRLHASNEIRRGFDASILGFGKNSATPLRAGSAGALGLTSPTRARTRPNAWTRPSEAPPYRAWGARPRSQEPAASRAPRRRDRSIIWPPPE